MQAAKLLAYVDDLSIWGSCVQIADTWYFVVPALQIGGLVVKPQKS